MLKTHLYLIDKVVLPKLNAKYVSPSNLMELKCFIFNLNYKYLVFKGEIDVNELLRNLKKNNKLDRTMNQNQ
jgi:hypothetical protein